MSKYFYGTGKRKTSVARVFLKPGKGNITINGRDAAEYFSRPSLLTKSFMPLGIVEQENKMDLYITVKGGGKSGQAGAIRHGLSRALEQFNPDFRPPLKKEGFLTRDARMVERKKPGKPKARKSPQFSKR